MGEPGRGTVAFVLAGGRGERLHPLTRDRAKPAVPFAGTYRIIDFTLSNCVNSGVRRIHLLTQYKSDSLQRHVQRAWGMLPAELGEYVELVPPQQRCGERWYRGTADAVHQTLHVLERTRPRHVLVLGGDHVYAMDYRRLLASHVDRRAELTVACTELPLADASRMGVMAVAADGRVRDFQEKPAVPAAVPGRPDRALVSMGIYVFDPDVLARELRADAAREGSHDFGRDVIPRLVRAGRGVFGHAFRDGRGGAGYWRDIGTLDSYHEASMELLAPRPGLDLHDAGWPIRSHQPAAPPARIVARGGERRSEVRESLLAPGVVVSGAAVERAILGPGVQVAARACVEDAVILDGVEIGREARVRRAIVDKGARVADGACIGWDPDADRRRFRVTDAGVVVVPKGAVVEPAARAGAGRRRTGSAGVPWPAMRDDAPGRRLASGRTA